MLIDKRTAYKALKHEEEIHFQTLVSEAYGRAARIVDQMHGADAAKIQKLCNDIEDIACHIGNITMNDVVYAEAHMIFDKVKEIGKELTVNVQKPD